MNYEARKIGSSNKRVMINDEQCQTDLLNTGAEEIDATSFFLSIFS